MIFTNDLTWILFLPTVGALAVMATPARVARWVALAFAAVVFVLSMAIFFRDRKSTRLNSSHTEIYTLSLHDALPISVGALAVMATPARVARWVALAFAAVVFVLSMAIFFRVATNGYNFGDLNHPADFIHTGWISFKSGNVQFNIDYFLGVDGLSLPMVILNR